MRETVLRVHPTDIDPVKLIVASTHVDERGEFVETYNAHDLAAYGIDDVFVQDNTSRSFRAGRRYPRLALRSRQLRGDRPNIRQGLRIACLEEIAWRMATSPIILIALFGIPKAWRNAPTGAQGMVVGAFLLMIPQLRGQEWHGGDSLFGYRYPLEWLAAAGPLLVLSSTTLLHRLSRPKVYVVTMASVSVALHTGGAYAGSALLSLLVS